MTSNTTRREMMRQAGAAGVGALLPGHVGTGAKDELRIAGSAVELSVSPVSERTVRVTLRPIAQDGRVKAVPYEGALVKEEWSPPRAR